jgi:mycothiol synthase
MQITTLENYHVRPATLNDVEQAVILFNVVSMADFGVTSMDAERLRHGWQLHTFNVATDTLLVLTPDETFVGYIHVRDIAESHVLQRVWGGVHPDHRRRGISTALLQAAEARARQAIPLAPPDAQVVFGGAMNILNTGALALYEKSGLVPVRTFLRMSIDLHEGLPQPHWPAGITIRAHNGTVEDDRLAYETQEEAFQDHWGFLPTSFEVWIKREKPLNFDPSLWFLAMDGDQVAGVSLCHPHTPEDQASGFLGDLAVRRPWRRQGLALALLYHTFAEFHRQGKVRVALEVDGQNLTGATRLYERAGMHPIRQVNAYEKILRPGKDYSIQALQE